MQMRLHIAGYGQCGGAKRCPVFSLSCSQLLEICVEPASPHRHRATRLVVAGVVHVLVIG